ncbi:MAG: hypothetical protein ACJ8EL_18325, partial [Rhizomicrobium sp.]
LLWRHAHQRQRVTIRVAEGAQLQFVRLRALNGFRRSMEYDALGLQRGKRVDVGASKYAALPPTGGN